ncbi:MAG: TlyA family RNA methyltransferase [Pseudomonadota bacterium]
MSDQDPSRLDVILTQRGLAPSRSRARALIKNGWVRVDGETVTKPSSVVGTRAALDVTDDAYDFVSRAALKLDHGLDHFAVDPSGRVSLDIGASTGGFCDVLLRRGAAFVFAVDVGHGQLHPSLSEDDRVASLEGVNAKDLTKDLITYVPDLLVCDVSFISLMKALPAALSLAAPQADLITLVKPQFELGPEAIGKNGRVLPSRDEQRWFIDERITPFLARHGWSVAGITASPILGGEGTFEFLLHAQKA